MRRDHSTVKMMRSGETVTFEHDRPKGAKTRPNLTGVTTHKVLAHGLFHKAYANHASHMNAQVAHDHRCEDNLGQGR